MSKDYPESEDIFTPSDDPQDQPQVTKDNGPQEIKKAERTNDTPASSIEPAENAETTDTTEETDLEVTTKRPALKQPEKADEQPPPTTPAAQTDHAIIPARPAMDKTLNPRQEKALHYLERKRTRTERVMHQEEDGKHNGHSDEEPSTEELEDVATTKLPVPTSDQHGIGPRYEGNSNRRGARALLATEGELVPRTPRSPRLQRKRKLLVRHLVRKHIQRTRNHDARTSKRFWVTMISSIIAIIVIFLSASVGGSIIAYNFYNNTHAAYDDKINGLPSLMPRDNLKMYSNNGTLIGQMMEAGIHTSVPYDKMPKDLINATVATEDKSFWENSGFDLARIIQAAIQNLQHGGVVGGGSTITQQLIKNLVLQNQSQDITRKLQEVVLAPDLNNRYSKEDILEMYLNSNFYGEQAYGVDAAASVYFGLEDQPDKPAVSQLTLAQSAMIAGISNLPTRYNPWIDRDAALARLEVVLNAMVNNGYITKVQRSDALNEANQPDFFKHPKAIENQAPHFYDFVLDQLENDRNIANQLGIKDLPLTRAQLARSGMKVYTTLDLNSQNTILNIARQKVAALADRNVTNSAEVLIDYRTGAILALLGSLDYYNDAINGKFDVATQGYRQMGSSFKPYMYTTAFEQGVSPGQAVLDAPTTFNIPGSGPYTPENYTRKNYGDMTLRCALQNSLNVPAVKVMAHIGVDNVINKLKALGISYQGSPGLSTALGTLDMHLLDHVSGFGTFANGGVHMPYYAVQKVEFTNTGQTFEHQKVQGKQVYSAAASYMITDVLSDYQQRYNEFGICNPLNLRRDGDYCPGGDMIPVAVKTGTSDGFKNVLTIGYTSEFILGVWVGNSDNSEMYNITGIMGAAPIWHDAMLALMQGREARPLLGNPPDGLQKVQQSYSDGVTTSDWVLPGHAPSSNQTNSYSSNQKPAQKGAYCPSYSFGAPNKNAPAW